MGATDRIAEHEDRDDGVGTADRVRAGHRGRISPDALVSGRATVLGTHTQGHPGTVTARQGRGSTDTAAVLPIRRAHPLDGRPRRGAPDRGDRDHRYSRRPRPAPGRRSPCWCWLEPAAPASPAACRTSGGSARSATGGSCQTAVSGEAAGQGRDLKLRAPTRPVAVLPASQVLRRRRRQPWSVTISGHWCAGPFTAAGGRACGDSRSPRGQCAAQ
jgi:hypothetical protein